MAGGARGWVPVDDPRPLWDHPLADPDLFEVAHFLVNKGLSDSDINEYLAHKQVSYAVSCPITCSPKETESGFTLEECQPVLEMCRQFAVWSNVEAKNNSCQGRSSQGNSVPVDA